MSFFQLQNQIQIFNFLILFSELLGDIFANHGLVDSLWRLWNSLSLWLFFIDWAWLLTELLSLVGSNLVVFIVDNVIFNNALLLLSFSWLSIPFWLLLLCPILLFSSLSGSRLFNFVWLLNCL